MQGTRRAVGVVVALAVGLAAAGCSSDSGGAGDGAATSTAAPSGDGGGTTTTGPPALDDDLRLDQIQVVGTHNSFHEAADPEERALLRALDAEQAAQRTYTHPDLTTQLTEQKIRQIELDVFADAEGGRYAEPALRRQAGLPPLVETVPGLAEPGTKVLHEQDVDYHSVCPTLVACLTELRDWSDANPDHVPVTVNIQFKDGPLIFNVPDQARPEPWTAAAMEELDREITSVFPVEEIITPADVRGDAATLEEAVLAHRWPTLGESRGKVLFVMVNGEPYRASYRKAHPDLEGALLFTNADPGQPDAAFVGVDDPVGDGDEITALVTKGYVVRTRSDEPDEEARTGDTDRRDAALASGAQWVSTDHPGPDGAKAQYGTDYLVELPGFRAARCNPVTAPEDCEDEAVEPG